MGVDYQAVLVYGYQVEPPDIDHDCPPYEGEEDEYGCALHRQSYYVEDDQTTYVLCALSYWSDSVRHSASVARIAIPDIVTGSPVHLLQESAKSRGLQTIGAPGWFLFVQVS